MPGPKHVFIARRLEDAWLFCLRDFKPALVALSGDHAPAPEAKRPPGRRRPGPRVRGWPGAFRVRVLTTAVSTVVSSPERAPDLKSGSNRFDSCTTHRANTSVPGARKRT